MVEFFLGVIAVVLVIAFWEKVQPALEGTIKSIISIVKAPFKLFQVWIMGLVFTVNTIKSLIKHSWKTHKILFIIAIILFFGVLLSDLNVASFMTKRKNDILIWTWILKYFCGIFGVLGSIFMPLVTICDMGIYGKENITQIKSLQEIKNNDSLTLIVFSYLILLMYVIYCIFGIDGAMLTYTAIFIPFVVVGISYLIQSKIRKISKNKNG